MVTTQRTISKGKKIQVTGIVSEAFSLGQSQKVVIREEEKQK